MMHMEGAKDRAGSGTAGRAMREVENQVRTCQLCRLARTRTNAVPGEGNVRAEVMFIGEGPGYHEDKQGRPFVGAAGQFLNELLAIAGLSRGDVYIGNVIKCRPPNNRDPMPDEMDACAPYLERQIAIINPRIIVTLGRYSMARFFPGEKISQVHGTARLVDGRMCVAMYHPAAGLHQGSLADVIRSDFRKLPIYIEQARLMAAPPAQAVEERVEKAEEVRQEVVHEVETGAVLNGPESSPEAAVQQAVAEPEPPAPSPTQQVAPVPEAEPEPEPAAPPPAQATQPSEASQPARPARRKKAQEKPGSYEQLSLFDV